MLNKTVLGVAVAAGLVLGAAGLVRAQQSPGSGPISCPHSMVTMNDTAMVDDTGMPGMAMHAMMVGRGTEQQAPSMMPSATHGAMPHAMGHAGDLHTMMAGGACPHAPLQDP